MRRAAARGHAGELRRRLGERQDRLATDRQPGDAAAPAARPVSFAKSRAREQRPLPAIHIEPGFVRSAVTRTGLSLPANSNSDNSPMSSSRPSERRHEYRALLDVDERGSTAARCSRAAASGRRGAPSARRGGGSTGRRRSSPPPSVVEPLRASAATTKSRFNRRVAVERQHLQRAAAACARNAGRPAERVRRSDRESRQSALARRSARRAHARRAARTARRAGRPAFARSRRRDGRAHRS